METNFPSRHLRLSKKREQQIYRRIVFTLVLSVGLLFVLFNWGIQVLVSVADFWDVVRSGNQTNTTATLPPFPPRLEALPNATNSASLAVRGYATPGATVEFFLNNQSAGKILVTNDNTFVFNDVTLLPGENKISAIATDNSGNVSQPSPAVTIIYKSTAPKLIINTPSDGEQFSGANSEIQVFGRAEGASQVTVNGFWATLLTDGTFSHNWRLSAGQNKLIVVAQDEAGNKTTNERTVSYTP